MNDGFSHGDRPFGGLGFLRGSVAYMAARAAEEAGGGRAFAGALRRFGLTAIQFRALAVLLDAGPLAVTALARLAMVKQPTASKALGALGRRGLVERGEDESDRRVVEVRLTADGVAVAREACRAAEEAERAALERFPDLDAAVVRAALRSVVENGR